ncbi:MAG: amidoligase family protein [Deltaproteobacteria bacterium]|nr:amidoligase family protein [Deltaproteobacteria bacterium]
MRMLKLSLLGTALLALATSLVHAQDFLNDARHMFFDQSMLTRRFGIEIEFGKVGDDVIEKIIIEKLRATVVERSPNGELLFTSPYGEVRLKIEGQAWRYEDDMDRDPVAREKFLAQQKIDREQAPREIVFPPLIFDAADAIQSVGQALKDAGALGTTDNHAVSTQVNVEWPDLVKPDGTDNTKAIEDLVNLMRVYSNPEHARQIEEQIKVPAIRREYIKDYSPGMLAKLGDASYKPTARQLFDDFFYRQGVEFLNRPDAWTMPLEEAKQLLLAQPSPYVSPRVTKMQRLRVSSIILRAFQSDPIAQLIIGTRWAKPMPLVEFREDNTDFDIKSTIEETLGIVRSAEVFGNYDHDTLVSELTGIDPRDLVELRKNAEALRDHRRIVRYVLQDPKTDYIKNQNAPGENPVWIHLGPDELAARKLVVNGESIVFNRRHIHRDSIVGKYNPGLENHLVQQVMENKLVEAKFFEAFAHGSMPRALTLRELTRGRTVTAKLLVHLLNVEYPNGWVMKGAWDLSTESMFISDKLDLEDLLKKYRNGFETFRKRVEREMKGADPELVIGKLKEHPGYRGWKIVQMLAQPDLVFFQERLRIVREFRVEVQGGKVLSKGSTIDRYAYKSRKKEPLDPEEVKAVEKFTQKLVDSLPEELRFLPYGFDVALIENGEFKVIESNPGGNSSFLEENPASVLALDAYLLRYPELLKSGKLKLLEPKAQMQWILAQFSKLGIDVSKHFPGMTFTADDIRDPAYPTRKGPPTRCELLLTVR